MQSFTLIMISLSGDVRKFTHGNPALLEENFSNRWDSDDIFYAQLVAFDEGGNWEETTTVKAPEQRHG